MNMVVGELGSDGLKRFEIVDSSVQWPFAVSTVTTLFFWIAIHCPGEGPAVCILLVYQLACS